MANDSKYTPDACVTMTELMRQGFTKVEICAALDITKMTFGRWINPREHEYHEDFCNAYQKALMLQESWWMKRGRDNIGEGRDFNYPLFALYVANMFGFRSGSAKEDEMMAEIKKLKEQVGLG